jgi:hypothetical protein
MERSPFEHQSHCSPWEFSPEHSKGLYLNQCFVFAILSVEMWRTVVAKVHPNHNPEESRYLGHCFNDNPTCGSINLLLQ